MEHKSKNIAFFGIIFFVMAAFLFLRNTDHFANYAKADISINATCIITPVNKIVRGNSLSGLIESGSTVKILFGYYLCNEVKRGDTVAYNFSGDRNPIIKIVKGLPGDKFHLREISGIWNIFINGETAKNSKGEPYSLSEGGSKMLSLYERDYKGVIPLDAYLILGNISSGSLDSSRFGLVGKSDILGKVSPMGFGNQ
jgi:signal peptidase I